jgi:tetratricopeptide (TPR) repeat protein
MESARQMPRGEFLAGAQSLLSQGRFDEVIEVAEARVRFEPEFAEARFVVAFALVRIGRFQEAVGQLEELLRQQPQRKEAVFALANALLGAQRPEAALERFKQFIRLEPNGPPALLEAAKLSLRVGQPEMGRSYAARLTQLRPELAEGWFLLGSSNAILDHLETAGSAFRAALKRDPKHIAARTALFRVLVQSEFHTEAADLMRRGLVEAPNNSEFLVLLASACAHLGNDLEAESRYRQALDRDPETIGSYASFLQERGRFAEAGRTLERAIVESPDLGVAYYQLSELRTFTVAGNPLAEMARHALERDGLSSEQRMYLSYASSRASEAAQDYEQSTRYLNQANAAAFQIHNLGREYVSAEEKSLLERRCQRFSRAELEKSRNWGSTSNRSIFIVGMIRSGTTLLDQILSSHPAVESAGELKYWGLAADKWSKGGAEFRPEILRELSTGYQDRLNAFSDHDRVTDKMPLNYHHLGLIHSCFPGAKIIHIKRSPLDTCLSIYSTYLGRGPKWIYSQANIVSNYRFYESLMEHWRLVIPLGSMLEVEYESLVGSTESSVRSILEFCELPWNESCLHPERNTDRIYTPSRWQARQPIYRSSVSRSAKFLPYLGELTELSPHERSSFEP